MNGQNSRFDLLHKLQSDTISNEVRLETLLKAGWKYHYTDLDTTLIFAEEALQLAEKLENKESISEAYHLLGTVYFDKGVSQDSVKLFFDKALELAREIGKSKAEANVLNSIGLTYKSKGLYNEAFSYIKKSMILSEQNQDTLLMILGYNNMALLMRKQSNDEAARNYYRKGLRLATLINHPTYAASLNNNLGNTFVNEGDYSSPGVDSALFYFEKALALKKARGYEIETVTTLANIGHLKFEIGDFEAAETYLFEAYEIAKRQDYTYGLTLTLAFLGKFYYLKDEPQKAITYLNEIQEIASKKDVNIEVVTLTYEYLCQSYQKLGQYKLALESSVKYNELKDSIFDLDRTRELNQLEIQYNLTQKETENKLLKAKQKNRERVIKTRSAIFVISAIFLIALIITLIRAYRLKQVYNNELEQKNAALEELNLTKTQFFSNISHEFKTPLTLIISPIKQLLKRKNLDENAQYLLSTAERNSTQLLEITNQLLDSIKAENDFNKNVMTTFDFSILAHAIVSSFESLASDKKLHYTFDYQSKKPLFIISDNYKVKTIIKNLISNAIKYSKEKDKVAVQIIETENTLEITVSDEGQGIQKEDIPHIFDRFYQSKYQGSLIQGGTGIGLTITKQYVEALGGKISVKSEWQKGSEFTASIPKIVVLNVENSTSIIPTNIEVIPKDLTNNPDLATILIAEDNTDMQCYLDFILRPYYNVVTVPNGKLALEILTGGTQKIDLLITDLMMPVMNGHELLENVKQIPDLVKLPTIMLTALSNKEHRLKAFQIGINDYISKPFETEELLLRVEYLLEFKRERQNASINQPEKEAAKDTNENTNETEITISKEDEQWLEELEVLCLKKIGNPNLKMTELAAEMHISYSKLWRKTQALIGMTPSQYLKELRFREARKYLEEQKYSTIKQLAYAVGFKDEQNFSRNFKKRFGKNPSEL